ncbi:MAG TPA: PQQ-dependent sugar dehydrogenase [Polyangiaceae bacterium]|nr:PQQ-dependent sugar dehydrogenase [Polyangiaceae bacterium]
MDERARGRRGRARTLGLLVAGAALLLAAEAEAQLAETFADVLTIDEQYVTGVGNATDIAFTSDGRALVTMKTGDIVIRKLDGSLVSIPDLFPNLDTDSEKGLTGVTADPRSGNAFFFYVDNGPSTSDKHRVYHGVLDSENALTVDFDQPIVAAGVNAQDEGLEGPANHDGGGLWVYGGHLYVSVGDTGANSSPPTNKYSSCLNKGNGKILRVNLDGTIPRDNPLVGLAEVTACDSVNADWSTAAPDQRVYAWGLRNPFRFWVDPHTGRMWIGDVGEVTREEVSVSDPAASYTGQDFGYPFREGLLDWNTNGGSLTDRDCDTLSPSRPCTDPVVDYDHTVGDCVIGGLIPEGCGWLNAFSGSLYYLFADYGASWVRALQVKSDRSGVVSSDTLTFATFSSGPAAIRQSPSGGLYFVNNSEGSVYEIKPKYATGSDCISGGGMGGASGAGGTAATSSGGNAGNDAGESGTAGTPETLGGTGGTGGTRSTSTGGKGGGTRGGEGGSSPSGGASGESGAGESAGGVGGGPGGSAGHAGQTGGAGRSVAGGGGAGASGGGSSKDNAGCGCRAAGGEESSGALWALALVTAGGVVRRRRR